MYHLFNDIILACFDHGLGTWIDLVDSIQQNNHISRLNLIYVSQKFLKKRTNKVKSRDFTGTYLLPQTTPWRAHPFWKALKTR